MRTWWIIPALLIAPVAAEAQIVSTEALQFYCTAELGSDPLAFGACRGYVIGAADVLLDLQSQGIPVLCTWNNKELPRNAPGLAHLVSSAIQENAIEGNIPAGDTVYAVYQAAFPCRDDETIEPTENVPMAIDGPKLRSFCTEEVTSANYGFCMGYVAGIADMVKYMIQAEIYDPNPYCLPDSGNIMDVITTAMRVQLPPDLDPASVTGYGLLYRAFAEAYPCPTESGSEIPLGSRSISPPLIQGARPAPH